MPDRLDDNPLRSALFTDLYELTMAQAYLAEAMNDLAVFELSFRELPHDRNYLVAVGLEDVLAYLEGMRITDGDLAYLRQTGLFSEPSLERLKALRFTGDIFAVPEGTPVFPNEPLLQVLAPLFEAQLIETLVINQVHFQTLAATKAARVVTAAAGRTVVEFGARRAHGADAALKVARSSYLVGAAGTSLVLAGQVYGIPIFGTMAHSYIQAHDDEAEAFTAFASLYPETTLLVDTYDTLQGVQKVIDLSRRLGERFRVRAVRLDSGDLGKLARQTRKLLDEAGLHAVQIFVTSGLDEYQIAALVQSGAPIDGFGVGTKLAVLADGPYVDMVYKLVEYAGQPRGKLSSNKLLHPGRKQVHRVIEDGQMVRDVICRQGEDVVGEPLLVPVMRGGQRLPAGQIRLETARDHARREWERLPAVLHGLDRVEPPYPVEISEGLKSDLALLQAARR
jgi:nicotinate phosphoribosyltransferase